MNKDETPAIINFSFPLVIGIVFYMLFLNQFLKRNNRELHY